MIKKVFAFTIVLFVFSNQKVFAQWSYGVGFGTTMFFGDVTKFDPLNARPAVGAEIWYEASNFISFKVGGSIYQIAADDRLSKRNRSFRATNAESYSAIMFTLKKPRDRKRGRGQLWYPFSYLGVGLSSNDPEGKPVSGNKYWNLASIQPESKEIPVIVPFGLIGGGFVVNISRDLQIVLDAGLRVSTSDYMDGVSKKTGTFTPPTKANSYFNSITFGNENNRLGGDPGDSDWYGIYSFKLFYNPYDFDFRKKYGAQRSKFRRRRR